MSQVAPLQLRRVGLKTTERTSLEKTLTSSCCVHHLASPAYTVSKELAFGSVWLLTEPKPTTAGTSSE